MQSFIILASLAKKYVLERVGFQFHFLEEELGKVHGHGKLTARIDSPEEESGCVRLQYHKAKPDDPEGKKCPIEWEHGPEWLVPIDICLEGEEETLRYLNETYWVLLR